MTFRELFKKKALFSWIVILPMVLAILYYVFFAMDRYVSVSQVVVRQPGQDSEMAEVSSIALLMGGVNPTQREETLYLSEYVTSMDMLNILEKELNWHEHYAKQWWDPLYWLSEGVNREDMLEYYNRVVQVYFDDTTGLLNIEVQSFDPEFSERVLQVILQSSEKFVNEISHRMARDQLAFAESQLKESHGKYEAQKALMLDFQSKNDQLDATAAAKSRAEIIGTLESELTTQRANLKALQAVLHTNTPQVRQQRARIAALEAQLLAERQSLLSNPEGDKLNVVAARYHDLLLEATIAEEAYKASVLAVENARIEASKKIRSLVTVVSPNLAQTAIYPERIYNLITLFIGLLLLYGVVRFVIASIEDHRD